MLEVPKLHDCALLLKTTAYVDAYSSDMSFMRDKFRHHALARCLAVHQDREVCDTTFWQKDEHTTPPCQLLAHEPITSQMPGFHKNGAAFFAERLMLAHVRTSDP